MKQKTRNAIEAGFVERASADTGLGKTISVPHFGHTMVLDARRRSRAASQML